MTEDRPHEPVLEEVVLDHLAPSAGDDMGDLTVGAGGHAARVLGRTGPSGRLLGLDRDSAALEVARKVVAPFEDRAVLHHGTSDTLRAALRTHSFGRLQGVFMDLGVSSMQLDNRDRGFSFRSNGPLDMRMDASKGRSAMQLLKESTSEELEGILRTYGEEPSARRLAQRLSELCRRRAPRTTLELANFIESLHPKRPKGRSSSHPATRTFQALRIAVNDELGTLERTLPQATEALAPGGRLAIISFHSLEDRIVKNYFRDGVRSGLFSEYTKKPIVPDAAECRRNARSRSARFRVALRTDLPLPKPEEAS